MSAPSATAAQCAWLGGYIDGDGTLVADSSGPRRLAIAGNQAERSTQELVQRLLGGGGGIHCRPKESNAISFSIGRAGVMRWLAAEVGPHLRHPAKRLRLLGAGAEEPSAPVCANWVAGLLQADGSVNLRVYPVGERSVRAELRITVTNAEPSLVEAVVSFFGGLGSYGTYLPAQGKRGKLAHR
jgi:hypothetical protein